MNDFEVKMKTRNKKFAHACVKLISEFHPGKVSNHISDQLLRCSTSVAANYRAACVAQSKKSFVAKLGIVIEEADESDFWLEFALDEKIHSDLSKVKSLMNEARELAKIYIAKESGLRNTLIRKYKFKNQN